MLIEIEDRIRMLEFKCNQSAKIGLEQIKSKSYAEKYKDREKEIIMFRTNFNTEDKNISEWAMN